MMRRQDWRGRLVAVCDAAQGRAFEWGLFDCTTFVADCVEAMTDVDPMEKHRGHYQKRIGAARQYARAGGLGEAWGDRLGFPINVAAAGCGDVVAYRQGDETLVGIVDTTGRFFLAVTETGLHRMPLSNAASAWRIQ